MITWVLVIVPCFLIYFYLRRINQHWARKKVPYVKPLPLVGNVGKLLLGQQSQADLIQEVYNAYDSRYIGMHSFVTPALLIKDVDLLKQIGIKDFDHFVDHHLVFFDRSDPLFGKNLFSAQGDTWRVLRATVSPVFTGSKMRGMFILMSEVAQKLTDHFEGIVKPGETLTIELKDTFSRFANDIIASTAFGIPCDSLKEKNNDFYRTGKAITTFGFFKSLKLFACQNIPLLVSSLGVRMFTEDQRSFFTSIIQNNIKIREENEIIRPDLIHLLMEARKGKLKHEEKGDDEDAGFATTEESHVGKAKVKQEYMTDDAILSQSMIFFFAGFDTISTALCHTVYELALNPEIQERLQEEIDETLEKCNGKVTYDVIVKMKYLDMVFSEGLRKWPPVPTVDRDCVRSFTIQPEKPGEVPVTIQKGESIWLPIYALHRDPNYFPNPDKFDPERFSDENKGKILPFSYIPFGIGPRNCIGSRFALLEAKTLLFNLFSKFDFVVVKKTEIPIKITSAQFSMNAANGFWLGLKLRNK